MHRTTNNSLTAQIEELTRQLAGQQAETEALRQSERRYRDFFEEANDLIHVLDAEGRILYTNKLWRETLGFSATEATGMKIFDLLDASCTAKCRGIFSSLMRGERVPPTEAIFIAKDGREIFVEGRCSPKFRNGIAVELMGIFRDITEHKRYEAEREQLIAALQEAVSTVKTLEGYLPICAACKKIRDDQGYWNQLEVYLRKHTRAEFSHGICPDCVKELYPEFGQP